MAKFAKTHAEIAADCGVSRQTVAEWSRDPEFPSRTKRGWNLDRINQWCKRGGKGKYRRGSGGQSTDVDGLTLAEAKIKLTAEQAENERIKKERQLVEQAKELGDILDYGEVLRLNAQMIATVKACVDSASTAGDRAIPDSWEHKEKVMAIFEKLETDIAVAMSELW